MMKKTAETNYEVNVIRAKEFDNGDVSFDMTVNGVTIYGCWYKELTTKKGEPFEVINFPQRKGNDDKYYSYAYFKIDEDTKANIIKQLEALV